MSLAEPLDPPAPLRDRGRGPGGRGTSGPVAVEEFRRAAEALVTAAGPAPACTGAADCERPGALAVVTDTGRAALCAMHAMTVVFTTDGLVAVVKPAET